MMKRLINRLLLIIVVATMASCAGGEDKKSTSDKPLHIDKKFVQDYSIKYNLEEEGVDLINAFSDRNGNVQILSSKGLLTTRAGQFQFPGTLVKYTNNKATADKKIAGITIYENQYVYVDDKAVLSNSWAGNLYSRHEMKDASIVEGGKDFSFIISNGKKLVLLKDSKVLWEGSLKGDDVKDVSYDAKNDLFWILGSKTVSTFSPSSKKLEKVLDNSDITCIEAASGKVLVGTNDGYFEIDAKSKKQSEVKKKMPWTEITSITEIDGSWWFGSTWGAFKLREDGKYDYYASKRWLPSDKVISIAKGPESSVLVLTDKGLGEICFEEMTLHEKAMIYDKQMRSRHIRHGFNAAIVGMKDGDFTTGYMPTSDNDGLWTTMYQAGEVFRYAVTGSEEALQNVRESLDALERLYTINGIPGFPSRSYERRGYKYHDEPWRRAEDPEWDWKSTTSSDEAIGHIFVFGVIAELIDEKETKEKAIMLIDTLMSHIVKNDFYMIDWNGEPTLWAKWHPDYVNARPKMVGDRKINASNIIGMLQTAYHFTKKEKYKEAAFYLMDEHGYLDNLMRPMKEIGPAPDDADDWSKMLSAGWNHSDDEMYYCGYWGLYRYAFNDTLKAKYKEAIIDHFEYERLEKEGLWNIMTALVDADDIDLEEAVWYLQEYPLDLVNWTIKNSHRKDIELIPENFRGQTIKEILPASELRVSRHNANRFDLDAGGAGASEESPGDIWILPYWIGRYLGVISAPVKECKSKCQK
jgi:hypothetical protein